MAEGLILPEANQILLHTADGLQWANYPNVSRNAKDRRLISFHRRIHFHFFGYRLFSKSKDLHLKQEAQLHA